MHLLHALTATVMNFITIVALLPLAVASLDRTGEPTQTTQPKSYRRSRALQAFFLRIPENRRKCHSVEG